MNSVSTWIGDHQGRLGAVNLSPFVSVKYVTDRLSSRYRADTDIKWIKPNQMYLFAYLLTLSIWPHLWRLAPSSLFNIINYSFLCHVQSCNLCYSRFCVLQYIDQGNCFLTPQSSSTPTRSTTGPSSTGPAFEDQVLSMALNTTCPPELAPTKVCR